jgi:hypothetical protein
MPTINCLDEFRIDPMLSRLEIDRQIAMNIMVHENVAAYTLEAFPHWKKVAKLIDPDKWTDHMVNCLGAVFEEVPQGGKPIVKTYNWFPLHLYYDKCYEKVRLTEVYPGPRDEDQDLLRVEFNTQEGCDEMEGVAINLVDTDLVKSVLNTCTTWALFFQTESKTYRRYVDEETTLRRTEAEFYPPQQEQLDNMDNKLWKKMWQSVRGESAEIISFPELTIPGWKKNITKAEAEAESRKKSKNKPKAIPLSKQASKQTDISTADVTPAQGAPDSPLQPAQGSRPEMVESPRSSEIFSEM